MKRLILCATILGALSITSCGSGSNNPKVLIETSMGDIKVELYQAKAPVTVKNFLQYVDDKFYDGTVFHRVISDFMIQGGGFTPEGKEKETRDPIINEGDNGLKNVRGTLAMARTNDPDSATAQFFINVKDNDFLDHKWTKPGYAVFGKVIEGMDVVDKIRVVQTGTRDVDLPVGEVPMKDWPKEEVIIKSIRRIEPEKK